MQKFQGECFANVPKVEAWVILTARLCVQDEIIREAQTMRQQQHPAVLPLYCSFVHKENLWMVMPYIAGGSVLNIMKYNFQDVSCYTICHILRQSQASCFNSCCLQALC